MGAGDVVDPLPLRLQRDREADGRIDPAPQEDIFRHDRGAGKIDLAEVVEAGNIAGAHRRSVKPDFIAKSIRRRALEGGFLLHRLIGPAALLAKAARGGEFGFLAARFADIGPLGEAEQMLVLEEIGLAFRAGAGVVVVLRQRTRRGEQAQGREQRQADDSPRGDEIDGQNALPAGIAREKFPRKANLPENTCCHKAFRANGPTAPNDGSRRVHSHWID